MTLKIDYISDLHIEFYFREYKDINERRVRMEFDSVFATKQSDYLIVAGDTSEYPAYTERFFELLKELYGYKVILFTLGNHDIWLTGSGSKYRPKGVQEYKVTSLHKMQYISRMFEDNSAILLDGTIVDIEGFKIGGAMGWVDDSYFNTYEAPFRNPYSTVSITDIWKATMNDSKYIRHPSGTYDWLTSLENTKVHKVLQEGVDVLVTHLAPSIDLSLIDSVFHNKISNNFYMFNVLQEIKDYKVKAVIYGHMHSVKETIIEGIPFYRNPYGYPKESERTKKTVKTIEVHK